MSLLTFDRKRILFKAFFESQFKCCLLIGCFVAEEPIIESISYMNEPSEPFVITRNSGNPFISFLDQS